tara:strand:- start:261 stop:461 length:201 start_codon:yes stop_codon:yes gene_type:complete
MLDVPLTSKDRLQVNFSQNNIDFAHNVIILYLKIAVNGKVIIAKIVKGTVNTIRPTWNIIERVIIN